MRNILITEEQFRTLLKEYAIDDHVHFGEPVAINAYQVHMPVEIDGKEYTIDEINFIIEPKKVQGTQLYQPHIFIAPEFQKHGFCYRIFRAFIREYGNFYIIEHMLLSIGQDQLARYSKDLGRNLTLVLFMMRICRENI